MSSPSVGIAAISALLGRQRESVVATWIESVHRLPNLRTLDYSNEELRTSLLRGVDAVGEALSAESNTTLDAYLAQLCQTLQRTGADIEDATEGLLLWRQTMMHAVRQSVESSDDARAAIGQLDDCLRYLIGRFGHVYAEVMQRDLRAQQRRTALILNAVQTASGSLELDYVLERVAEGMADAVGVRYCGIYVMDSARGVCVARAATGGLLSARRDPFRDRCLAPAVSPLVREALETHVPVVCSDAGGDPRLSDAVIRDCGLKSALVVPIEAGDRMLGAAVLSTFDSMRTFSPEEIKLAAGISAAVALAIENARLYEETRRRLAESESLQRVTSGLLQRLSLARLLEIVCTDAQRLTGALGSTVLLLEDDWLRVAFSTGTALPRDGRIKIDGSLTGIAIQSGRPFLTNDPDGKALAQGWKASPTALLAIPLRSGDAIIGALDVVSKPGGFSTDDVRIMDLFAGQVSIAIENARLYQQEEQLAVMEERQRIARELHDSVTQSLYSMTLYAEAAARLLASGNQAAAAEHLDELRDISREALREMRVLIFELRPPALEDAGLAAALQTRLDGVEARVGLQSELQVTGSGRLPSAVEDELYRIAQEALNNVLKHARARRVVVRLELDHELARLEVSDDGVGFDPAAARESGGIGLRGIEERAGKIGGHLRITSALGRGTTVSVSIGTRRNSAELIGTHGNS